MRRKLTHHARRAGHTFSAEIDARSRRWADGLRVFVVHESVCARQMRLDENAVLAGERAPLRRERLTKGGLGAQRGVQVGKMASR